MLYILFYLHFRSLRILDNIFFLLYFFSLPKSQTLIRFIPFLLTLCPIHAIKIRPICAAQMLLNVWSSNRIQLIYEGQQFQKKTDLSFPSSSELAMASGMAVELCTQHTFQCYDWVKFRLAQVLSMVSLLRQVHLSSFSVMSRRHCIEYILIYSILHPL